MGSGSFTMVMAQALTVLIPMILSLTVHEFAHAFVAKRLGDDTAEMMGRLNLNPLSHADLFGTIILPMVTLMSAGVGMRVPFFGWAKPVPVNAGRFHRHVSVRWGSTAVAAAGPLSNLFLSITCAVLLSVGLHHGVGMGTGGTPMPFYVQLLYMMVTINAGLFVFNLIPIYPLDGQKVLSGFLSPARAINFERFNQQYGVWVLWGIILLGRGLISVPVVWVVNNVLALVGLG